MKIYGWNDVGVARGELEYAHADAGSVAHLDALQAAPRTWEVAFTRFTDARSALRLMMIGTGEDPADADLVKDLRASDIPEAV